jgi:hypothetical protein
MEGVWIHDDPLPLYQFEIVTGTKDKEDQHKGSMELPMGSEESPLFEFNETVTSPTLLVNHKSLK